MIAAPDLSFSVLSAEPQLLAAAPTLCFRLRVTAGDPEETIKNVLLQCQIQIDATRRKYADGEQTQLLDLFGEPRRWGDTLRTMLAERKEFLARAFHRSGAMDAGEALAALPWVRTAEEAAAWAVAFGLNEQIDRAFDRSLRASGSDLSDKDWYSIWFAPLADSDLFDNLRSR